MNSKKVASELLKVAKDLVLAEQMVTAGCEKLPEGKMREMCEKKKKESRDRMSGCEKLPEGKMREMCEKKKKESE